MQRELSIKNASFVISVHDEEVFFMPYKDKSKQQAAQRKYNAKRAGERTRGYATIVYPESAPSDWKEILADLKIQVLISPLHDQDVNPTGEPKKPHYHVMLMFEGPKSSTQAKAVIATFGGIGCEVINSTRGYARYLCHLDNPEKHRYSPSDVQQFGGVDYQSTVELASDLRAIGKEIRRFCREYHIVSFSSLIDYADEYQEEWLDYLDSHGWLVKEYLKSRTWSIEHGADVNIKELLDKEKL